MNFIATHLLKLLPLWFGLFFLAPVMAEIVLRPPLLDWLPSALAGPFTGLPVYPVYGVCMLIGGIWGFIALKTGRWI